MAASDGQMPAWLPEFLAGALGAIPGWLAFFSYRHRKIENEGRDRERLSVQYGEIKLALEAIRGEMIEHRKALADHMKDDEQVTRQIHASFRDIDIGFVNKSDFRHIVDTLQTDVRDMSRKLDQFILGESSDRTRRR